MRIFGRLLGQRPIVCVDEYNRPVEMAKLQAYISKHNPIHTLEQIAECGIGGAPHARDHARLYLDGKTILLRNRVTLEVMAYSGRFVLLYEYGDYEGWEWHLYHPQDRDWEFRWGAFGTPNDTAARREANVSMGDRWFRCRDNPNYILYPEHFKRTEP